MTLILKFNLDIVKLYHYTKNELSMSNISKVIAQTDRQTDTHIHTHTHYENITSTAHAEGKNNQYIKDSKVEICRGRGSINSQPGADQ